MPIGLTWFERPHIGEQFIGTHAPNCAHSGAINKHEEVRSTTTARSCQRTGIGDISTRIHSHSIRCTLRGPYSGLCGRLQGSETTLIISCLKLPRRGATQGVAGLDKSATAQEESGPGGPGRENVRTSDPEGHPSILIEPTKKEGKETIQNIVDRLLEAKK